MDLYTKAVLMVIALMLTVIACKPLMGPETTASVEGPFVGVVYRRCLEQSISSTRERGRYNRAEAGKPFMHWRVTTLGQPMVKVE